MFTLQVLGTNGLYPTENSPTSGYLVNCNGLRYLVDIGCGIFNKVKEIMPPEDLDGIIVTHYHFDHVSDIGVLSYYLQTKNKRVTVYGPDDGSPYQKLISDSPYFDRKGKFKNLFLQNESLGFNLRRKFLLRQ